MFKTKKFFSIFIITCFVLLFNIGIFAAPYVNFKITYDNKTYTYNKERVYLYVNSNKVDNLPLEPIIINNYTLVPAREVFEKIGASVTWIKSTEQIQIVYKDMVVLMKINDNNATVNGKPFKMSIPPKLINGKTMIPVRFVSEAINLVVDWKNDERIINISEPKMIEPTTEETTIKPISQSQNNNIIIEKIDMPDSDERTFAISFNKKIEKFEKVILEDGSVAIDIYNSKNNIKEGFIESITEFVSDVTIENKENNITRFIFKTKSSVLNTNFLSQDGKTLYINFGGNSIKKLELFNDGKNDILKIYGEFAPDVNISKESTTNIANIEIKNATFVHLKEDIKETKYIESIDHSKSTNSLVNIQIMCKEDVDLSHSKKDNVATIVIGKEVKDNNLNNSNIDINNISSGRQFKIEKRASQNIDLNNIKHIDNYLDKEYILTFNEDITNLINEGEYKINNDLVDSIVVENVNGITQLVLNCKKITAVNVTEDNQNIYVNMLLPKEKYKNIVVIDPGHGGSAPGTSGNGLVEKDINLDISLRLNDLFKDDKNIKAYFTRLDDTNPSFNDRTDMSNEVGDIFISIHQNASGNGGQGPNGTEVFYLNPNTNDRGITSKYMAQVLQKNLLEDLDTLDRKIKTSNLIVLRNNKIPSVLCEICFLSNPSDASRIAKPEFRQKAAKSIYDSVVEIFEQYPSKR